MRAPLSWLRELVDLPAGETGRDVAERLIRAGLEVDSGLQIVFEDLKGQALQFVGVEVQQSEGGETGEVIESERRKFVAVQEPGLKASIWTDDSMCLSTTRTCKQLTANQAADCYRKSIPGAPR